MSFVAFIFIMDRQLPPFIINASIIGVAWGLLRLISGSVLVLAVAHGIWNGAVYVLFNKGTEIGALGIQETSIFGPEAGVLALGSNIIYMIGLWVLYRRAEAWHAATLGSHRNQGVQRQYVAQDLGRGVVAMRFPCGRKLIEGQLFSARSEATICMRSPEVPGCVSEPLYR